MPKGKSHKSSLKRFKVTSKGKLKRYQANKSHLNSHKSGKRKRQLRRPLVVENAIALKYVHLLNEN